MPIMTTYDAARAAESERLAKAAPTMLWCLEVIVARLDAAAVAGSTEDTFKPGDMVMISGTWGGAILVVSSIRPIVTTAPLQAA